MWICVHHVLHKHRQCGEAIVGNAEGQKSFVEDVLALQTKLETMLRQAFFMQVRGLVEECCTAATGCVLYMLVRAVGDALRLVGEANFARIEMDGAAHLYCAFYYDFRKFGCSAVATFVVPTECTFAYSKRAKWLAFQYCLWHMLFLVVTVPVSNELQEGFKSALKSAFEHFLNLKHSQSAYLIAKFVDKQLKGEKGTTEQEVEARLDQVRCALCVVPWVLGNVAHNVAISCDSHTLPAFPLPSSLCLLHPTSPPCHLI
jgi:hypothetical protein